MPLKTLLKPHARVVVATTPTPVEPLANLGAALGLNLFVKRDDQTGVAFGGNKVRQLEFYFGKALAQRADTILITGAVQSNFTRTAAAFAARFGMECHIQQENRVPDTAEIYHQNGNVLLNRLMGAHLHTYADGEDEAGADRAMLSLAEQLRQQGRRPFVIPLGADHPPLGALGYMVAAEELASQLKDLPPIDEIILPTGSALTHVGLLFGLRQLGLKTPVRGICVRRDAVAQRARVLQRCDDLARLLNTNSPVAAADIRVSDTVLAPGYGRMSDAVTQAISLTAKHEGLFLDPVYTGKAMAGLIALRTDDDLAGKTVLFWHTGGLPALFAYGHQLP